MKKLFALVLAVIMAVSLTACAEDVVRNQGAEQGTVDEVEVNVSDVHMDAAEASASGNWEALFTPVEVEGRAIDMADFDLTPTTEELAAMQSEPAYSRNIIYGMKTSCSVGATLADELGYFEEAGLKVEGVKSDSTTEALGAGKMDVGIEHIATMLVPITNGMNITFTGGAHIGCRSIYVLADSEYETTADLKGTSVGILSGIGGFDYNIASMLFDADGVNPMTDVTLTQIAVDATIAALENGELSAAMLSDFFAYSFVKEGKLKCIRSLLDEDFATHNCCVIAMNRTFVEENPTIAKKLTQAIQKAHAWLRDNPEEGTQFMLDSGWYGGDYEMNVMIGNALQFGTSDEFTEKDLKELIASYIRLGLITSMDDVDEIMDLAWTPVL